MIYTRTYIIIYIHIIANNHEINRYDHGSFASIINYYYRGY